ncbi:AsmA family protein [Lichenicola sp.]|uniref:AsmA family protein n=1 Tax=Lichenicola sp. TaxID=2804529 RepID=UPI003B00150F
MAISRGVATADTRGNGFRRLVRPLLLLVLLLVLVVVGVALLVQSRLDPEQLRQSVERDVLRQTGRQLSLGSLHVQLLPVPTLDATQVSFANWDGGQRPQMLTADGLHAHLALLPMLGHVLRLEGLTLDHPAILLERRPDGTANWQLHKQVRPEGEPSGPVGSHSAPWQIQVGSARLLDGSVAWKDELHGSSGAAEGLRGDGSGLDGDHPAITLAGMHGGAGFLIDARTGRLDRLDPKNTVDAGTPWPLHVAATEQLDGHDIARLTVDGSFTDPARERGYVLDVDAGTDRLDALNALFPHAKLPAAQGVSLRTHVVDAAGADAPHGQPEFGSLAFRASGLPAASLADHAGGRGGRLLASLVVGSLSVDARDRTSPVSVSLDGRWRDQPLSLHGTAGTLAGWQGWAHRADDHTVPVDPATLDLAMTVGKASAQLRGSVARNNTDLQLEVRAPSLRQLLASGPDLTDLAVSGHLQLLQDKPITLSGVKLDSRQVGMTGSGSWLGGAHPTLTASIDATHVDVDALRAGWSSGPAVTPQTGARPIAPSGPVARPSDATGDAGSHVVPFDALKLADLAVQLGAHDVMLGRQTYHDLKAGLSVQDGRLSLVPFSVTGPAGPIAGRLQANAADDQVSLTLQPSMIRAETLASLADRPPVLHGVLELVADLHAAGPTREALLGSMSGRFGASLVDGSVANASLAGLVGRSVGMPSGGDTELRCLALPASVAGGIATLSPLALQTKRLDVGGHGTVVLADGRLDLHLMPRLSIGVAGASLPVHVGGRLDDPQAALDPAAPGGRFALTIGPGGPAPDLCGPALAAARFGNPGPQPPPEDAHSADRPHKLPKPLDILRGLGLLR